MACGYAVSFGVHATNVYVDNHLPKPYSQDVLVPKEKMLTSIIAMYDQTKLLFKLLSKFFIEYYT